MDRATSRPAFAAARRDPAAGNLGALAHATGVIACGRECFVLVDAGGLEGAVQQVSSMHHFAIRCHGHSILPLRSLDQ